MVIPLIYPLAALAAGSTGAYYLSQNGEQLAEDAENFIHDLKRKYDRAKYNIREEQWQRQQREQEQMAQLIKDYLTQKQNNEAGKQYVLEQITAIPAIDGKQKIERQQVRIVMPEDAVMVARKPKAKSKANTEDEQAATAEVAQEQTATQTTAQATAPKPEEPNDSTKNQGKRTFRQKVGEKAGKLVERAISGKSKEPKPQKPPLNKEDRGLGRFIYRTSRNTPEWTKSQRQLYNLVSLPVTGAVAVEGIRAGKEYVYPYIESRLTDSEQRIETSTNNTSSTTQSTSQSTNSKKVKEQVDSAQQARSEAWKNKFKAKQ